MARASADKKTWLDNPALHREARAAMEAAFRLLAPQNGTAGREDVLRVPNGRIAFEMLWDEVRHYNPKSPIDVTRPRRAEHQRRLTWLREALGTLPDRVVLWGKTGKEARRYQQALSLPELKEFSELARERIETRLSREKHKRLQELFEQAPPELKQRLNLGDLSNPGPFGKIVPTNDEESGS